MRGLRLLGFFFLWFDCSYAKSTPSFLEEGVITINLKDGTVYTFDAAQYKIVKRKLEQMERERKSQASSDAAYRPPRKQNNFTKPKRPSAPTNSISNKPRRPTTSTRSTRSRKKQPKQKQIVYRTADATKNRFSVLAGFTNNGFQFDETRNANGSVEIEISKRSVVVLGLSYSRVVYKSFSVTGVVLTSQTFLGGVGYEW